MLNLHHYGKLDYNRVEDSDMAEKNMLDRAIYKRVKSMNREEMSEFVNNVYMQGVEDSVIDLELLRERIGQIKGVGEARLDEIMKVIEDTVINADDE